jgi:hypothetical protein
MNYTECSFIARTSTAGLSHRKFESVGTSSDKRGAQDNDKKRAVYTDGYDDNNDDIGNNKNLYY